MEETVPYIDHELYGTGEPLASAKTIRTAARSEQPPFGLEMKVLVGGRYGRIKGKFGVQVKVLFDGDRSTVYCHSRKGITYFAPTGTVHFAK